MTRLITWLNNSVVLLLLLIAGFTLNLVLLGRAYGLEKSDWASWVQAVGSIIAIGGSVWAALHASSTERRAREENDRQAAISHFMFARAVFTRASTAINHLKFHAMFADYDGVRIAVTQITTCLATLEALFEKSDDLDISRLLASVYELLANCQADGDTAALRKRGTDLATAEVTAKISDQKMNSLRKELTKIGERMGAPPAPSNA